MRVAHHHLVTTRDVGAYPDRHLYYLIRDYVPGVTLRDVLVTVATVLGALLIAALPYVLR